MRHGHARRKQQTSEYRIWNSMRDRCKPDGHPDYGRRGIRVCERWHTFENFLADMGARPSREHSIDRRDNDGHYGPDNCRWATRVEQRANQRVRKDAIWIECGDERRTLDDWARVKSIKYGTLHRRIKNGWSAERAINTPTRGYS